MNIEHDRCFGFVENGVIGINLVMLWQHSYGENDFTSNFAKTFTHEMLHIRIQNCAKQISRIWEERVIRTTLGEEWDEELEEMYNENS